MRKYVLFKLDYLVPLVVQLHALWMWDNIKRDFPVRGCFEKVHRQDPLFCFDASISLLCGYIYSFFPCGSEVKASACNVGDLGSISGSGKLPGEEMATHSSILAWTIPWTEEPDGLQSMGSQRVRLD